MKQLVAIVLVFTFCFQNIGKLLVLINFAVNREYIAKNLCVNREKSDNCCKGKCELKKDLEEQEKKESIPNSVKEKSEVLFIGEKLKQSYVLYETFFMIGTGYCDPRNYENTFGIFRPPRV
jgi:hypothetical protein